MYWSDGSIYRGFWSEGVQSGLGLMIFKDGMRKAGFFENNVYKKPLSKIGEFEQFEKRSKETVPEAFRQEIKEYVGQLVDSEVEEDNSKFIG